jgi:transposase InsO family protein
MHANARLTPRSRWTLVQRIQAGRPVGEVAAEMGVSAATGYKWWARWRAEGNAGLQDRSSRPHRSPNRTARVLERRIERLRRSRKLGPARIGGILEVAHSTVHRVLVRRGLNRLAWMDRPTGQVIRRIDTSRPGELVHVDTKQLGRIPPGGGWWAWGREVKDRDRHHVGYAYVHAAIDAHSRIAYAEVLDDQRGETCAGFWTRAQAWFADHGVSVERILTDNARNYIASQAFQAALGTITHTRIRPRRPQTNGKVERFNRTLLDEWAYVRIYRSDAARTAALDRWLHGYNHHRAHTALGGQTPMSVLNNLPGHHS